MKRVLLLAAASLLTACSNDVDDDVPPEPTYENVAAKLSASCTFSGTCHGGTSSGSASLNFAAAMGAGEPLTTVLNGVPSCEYDRMPRVDPGDPDNSWLMVKLGGDFDPETGALLFTPADDWTPAEDGPCPLRDPMTGDVTFGTVMPKSIGAPTPLSDADIEMFRQWIAMGAPGPGE